ncbi:LysR family transcriptional regulator [Undibacterium parvum]|uniref:LysR family transcriptional regulator n=2 Tax=Undibacterium TaxID=401469 RepID=A0A6M4A110_9BURK|nr:LysR family transcriptional regulator [Undibacterium parvum]AZP13863.1 LysR family transcriptional regulator [Undibacterium parvum]QJQ04834.1 LysR family transcriptional regulator [Undibacterium piscinae]
MNAKTQFKLSSADLAVLLALSRTGTLALAGERLEQDASTVFRSIQRIEKGIGQRLFERSRSGYQTNELAQQLTAAAEQIEIQLEAARTMLQMRPEQVSGFLRISSTDTLLHGVLAPALQQLRVLHPLLEFDLHAGNELVSLTRRDADIALRATKRPPPHLIGKRIGPIRVALFSAKSASVPAANREIAYQEQDWIAPDEALPEHPSVIWRKKHYPKIVPKYRVNSILTVTEFVARGLGVGILPIFLAQGRADLIQVSEVLDECQTDLWLLTHTEARHLRRVSTVFSYLAEHLHLD